MAIHKKTKDKYWQGCVHAGKNVQCINWFNQYGKQYEVPQKS